MATMITDIIQPSGNIGVELARVGASNGYKLILQQFINPDNVAIHTRSPRG